MSIIAVRHGLSEANNRDNIGTLAFAASDAHLMELGRMQAKALHSTLKREFGINPIDTPAAVSTFRRTHETAQLAGHAIITAYANLDEVSHGMELPLLRQTLDTGTVPESAIMAAEELLEHPPSESIWYTHGLIIAGLCKVLDQYQKDSPLIPKFCTARVINLDS